MRVSFLDCGTCCPIGGWIASGRLGKPARASCTCLLIETGDGLVLVDTGFGTGQIRDPAGGIGAPTLRVLRPKLDPEETAVRQIEARGYEARDVRHVILTHLDLDHAGGLPDFPEARVHVLAAEHRDATRGRSLGVALRYPLLLAHPLFFAQRYRPFVWSHGPRWTLHEPGAGERWFGFEGVRTMEGLPPEILLVPLPGHTFGHMGVAVDVGDRWILHAGDAYFHRGQLDPGWPHPTPLGMKLIGTATARE